MPKYIKKKALKDAISELPWHHINPKGELVTGAYGEEDALVKYSDIKKIIKGLPTRKFEDEPMKTTDYCDICKRDMCEVCVADATNPYCVPSHYEINYEPKDEPQTDCAWK